MGKMNFDVPAAPAEPQPRQSYFAFDRMIAPELIKWLHALGFVAAILGSIWLLILGGLDAADENYNSAIMGIIGFFAVVAGYLWFRVVCEFLIVQFKIKESLEK
jgi:hypothetical protein